MQDSNGLKSLDHYCERFRRQMAIGMIAPILLSMKMTGMSDFTRDIELAYGSFGIAWRLLDDIRDIGEDIETGSHTALYLCLPQKVRTHWNRHCMPSRAAAEDATHVILDHILEYHLIDKIKERICAELDTAASLVEAHNMTGFAREFRRLAHPLENCGNTEEEDNGKQEIVPPSK